MERFVKIVIEAAARKNGATVKVSVWKEGDAMNLYQHQQDALEQTKHLNRVAFYHDMGL